MASGDWKSAATDGQSGTDGLNTQQSLAEDASAADTFAADAAAAKYGRKASAAVGSQEADVVEHVQDPTIVVEVAVHTYDPPIVVESCCRPPFRVQMYGERPES